MFLLGQFWQAAVALIPPYGADSEMEGLVCRLTVERPAGNFDPLGHVLMRAHVGMRKGGFRGRHPNTDLSRRPR